jgi:CRP-like cAMP-binding protein
MFTPESKEVLYDKAPRFERAYRILMQRHLAVTQNRLFDTISKTATDKYVDFLEQYPTLPKRFAQHYIASYLGMTPEFLSKIRKNFHLNNPYFLFLVLVQCVWFVFFATLFLIILV